MAARAPCPNRHGTDRPLPHDRPKRTGITASSTSSLPFRIAAAFVLETPPTSPGIFGKLPIQYEAAAMTTTVGTAITSQTQRGILPACGGKYAALQPLSVLPLFLCHIMPPHKDYSVLPQSPCRRKSQRLSVSNRVVAVDLEVFNSSDILGVGPMTDSDFNPRCPFSLAQGPPPFLKFFRH